MPATLFSDLEFSTNQHNNKVIEDTRALQVALELSMLYMNGEQRQQKAESPMSGGPSMDSSSMVQNYIPNGFPEEPRNKKSQNMTECVPVPSSEHVAEIVGRQGNIFIVLVFLFLILCVRRIVMVQQRTHCVPLRYANLAFIRHWVDQHVGLFSEPVGIPGAGLSYSGILMLTRAQSSVVSRVFQLQF